MGGGRFQHMLSGPIKCVSKQKKRNSLTVFWPCLECQFQSISQYQNCVSVLSLLNCILTPDWRLLFQSMKFITAIDSAQKKRPVEVTEPKVLYKKAGTYVLYRSEYAPPPSPENFMFRPTRYANVKHSFSLYFLLFG